MKHQINYIHFYVHACVYNMMGPELRICLVLFTFILDQLGFIFMLGSYASCYTLGYGWLMMIQMLYLFYPMFMMLNVVNQEYMI